MFSNFAIEIIQTEVNYFSETVHNIVENYDSDKKIIPGPIQPFQSILLLPLKQK